MIRVFINTGTTPMPYYFVFKRRRRR